MAHVSSSSVENPYKQYDFFIQEPPVEVSEIHAEPLLEDSSTDGNISLAAVTFNTLWSNFKYLPDEADYPNWLRPYNSCAFNLSNALRLSGSPNTMRNYGETTPYHGNSLLFRVTDVNAYLQGNNIGNKIRITQKADITGKKGILAFKIAFNDATGHLTLWKQDNHHPNDHFLSSTAGQLDSCFQRSTETLFYELA